MRSRVYETVGRPSVPLSHFAPQPRHAAGLLLWARQAGKIDRLQHGAPAATRRLADVISVMFTAT